MRDLPRDQVKSYLQDKKLVNNIQFDLLRGSILGVVATIILFILILKVYEQLGGLNTNIFLLFGLIGVLIALYKPGRPAQIGRKSFSIPNDYSEYEKKLETVMFSMRNRMIVILLISPYFLWLFYIRLNKEIEPTSNFDILFGSAFLSFLMTLILALTIQWFQIWWSLGKSKKR